MQHLQVIQCPECQDEDINKNGKNSRGTQRYCCKSCGNCFQTTYCYEACQPGISEQIIAMAMNGSGVRDTGRVLKISTGTVLRTLKKKVPPSNT